MDERKDSDWKVALAVIACSWRTSQHATLHHINAPMILTYMVSP